MKVIIRETYRVKKIFFDSKSGIIHKIKVSFISLVFSLLAIFAPFSTSVKPETYNQTPIVVQMDSNSTQSEQSTECSQSPSVQKLLKVNGGIKIKQGLVHVQKVLHSVQLETILVTLE